MQPGRKIEQRSAIVTEPRKPALGTIGSRTKNIPTGVREFSMDIVRDPGTKNTEANRILLPSGWTGKGEVRWDFQSVASMGLIRYHAVSGDGKADIFITSARHYVQTPGNALFGQGGEMYYGYPNIPVPSTVADYCTYYVPKLDSDLTDIRVSKTSAHPLQKLVERVDVSRRNRIFMGTVDGTCRWNLGENRANDETVVFHRTQVFRQHFLAAPGNRLTRFAKPLRSAEQERPDIAAKSVVWRVLQFGLNPKKLVFLDETPARTNMTRLYGRAPVGERRFPHV